MLRKISLTYTYKAASFKPLLRIIFWGLMAVILPNSIASQDLSKKTSLLNTKETADSCEESTLKINSVKEWYLREMQSVNDSIVVVGYSSKKETSKSVNRRRLRLAEKGLAKLGINKENITLAEGLTNTSLPRLDFYVKGRIVDRIITNNNMAFCTECCNR